MRSMSNGELRDHLGRLDESGYTVVEEAMDPGLLGELRRGLAEVEAEHDIGYRKTTFEGTRTVRIYNLLAMHRVFERIPVSPLVLPIMEQVLD
ncbi:MAG: phytanoyl-CoA dioxygenase, partial [Actinomycetia bacterium]|nr:phytanoyl-CoA dioxygenase [Actinomycetes bacterium]